jgi:hypothetical protein
MAGSSNHTANGSPIASRNSEQVILVGTPRTATSDAADRLLDGITVALQEFDTETLNAIADYRDSIHKDGWMQRLIREYVESASTSRSGR